MKTIRIVTDAGPFASNKDVAMKLRTNMLQPALAAGKEVAVSFEDVDFATQSFVHALINPLVRDERLGALDLLVFTNCNDRVKATIELVVDYSQGRITEVAEVNGGTDNLAPRGKLS